MALSGPTWIPYGRHEDHELWDALGHVALKVKPAVAVDLLCARLGPWASTPGNVTKCLRNPLAAIQSLARLSLVYSMQK